MKQFELRSLVFENGWYRATMYNKQKGYFMDQCFLYYTKKEVLWKLRNEYDCMVSRYF